MSVESVRVKVSDGVRKKRPLKIIKIHLFKLEISIY